MLAAADPGQRGEGAGALGGGDSRARRSAMLLHQDEPGLPMRDQTRLFGMLLDVRVHARGEGVAERAQFGVGMRVVIFGVFRGFVGANQDVVGSGRAARRLRPRGPAMRM